MIKIGKSILSYERSRTNSYSFETGAYGLKALCINTNFISPEIMIDKTDSEKHDIIVGFHYDGQNWEINLRSVDEEVDVLQIARERGGDGCKGIGVFKVQRFEDIFK